MQTLEIKSKSRLELINITDSLKSLIADSEVASGMMIAFVPHTTATIICNEDEKNLTQDILNVVKSVDTRLGGVVGGFAHDHQEGPPRPAEGESGGDAGNAYAHIVNSFSEGSRIFIIENNQLQLGTWQQIMFLEMDGPRERKIWVNIIEDK